MSRTEPERAPGTHRTLAAIVIALVSLSGGCDEDPTSPVVVIDGDRTIRTEFEAGWDGWTADQLEEPDSVLEAELRSGEAGYRGHCAHLSSDMHGFLPVFVVRRFEVSTDASYRVTLSFRTLSGASASGFGSASATAFVGPDYPAQWEEFQLRERVDDADETDLAPRSALTVSMPFVATEVWVAVGFVSTYLSASSCIDDIEIEFDLY